jgi:hypothetical protein
LSASLVAPEESVVHGKYWQLLLFYISHFNLILIHSALEFTKYGASGLVLHYLGDKATEEEIKTLEQEIKGISSSCRVVAVPGDIGEQQTAQKVSHTHE